LKPQISTFDVCIDDSHIQVIGTTDGDRIHVIEAIYHTYEKIGNFPCRAQFMMNFAHYETSLLEAIEKQINSSSSDTKPFHRADTWSEEEM
jgi:hypothetical protein